MMKLTPVLSLAMWLASLGAVQAQEMAKPLGKWERKIGKSHVTLTIEENRLHATFIGEKPCTLHADYSMTKDGVLYGVVTSIEYDEDDDSTKAIFDAPFSCRFRIDEGALIIRDLKCHEVDSKDDVWNGRFKPIAPTTASRISMDPATRSNAGSFAPSLFSVGSAPSSSPSVSAPVYQFWTGYSR